MIQQLFKQHILTRRIRRVGVKNCNNFIWKRSVHWKRRVWVRDYPMFVGVMVTVSSCLMVIGCTPKPPSERPSVSAPIYSQGNAVSGEQLYEEHCLQCHKLQLGSNKKGPQLLGVYHAPAAYLEDYKYSEALAKTGWQWDAKTLDKYIADPIAVLPDTRMLSDPIPNNEHRQDIIAYLSTLGRDTSSAIQKSTSSDTNSQDTK